MHYYLDISQRRLLYVQWFNGWASLASDDFQELKAVVVKLDLGGVVILHVDLTRAKRTTVLGLCKQKACEYIYKYDKKNLWFENKLPYKCSWSCSFSG